MAGIVGRAEPLKTVEQLLDQAMQHQGGAVVLRGEAGIGKSVLLDHALRTARERRMRVLSVTGVQAEVHVPYAGIDHLLRPVLPGGMYAESPYRLAMQVLDRLGEQDAPTLLALEDAHWLDAATWETLTFLGRRIEAEGIAVIMAVRDGEDIDRRLAAAGLPELPLEALSPADAGTLLDRTAPGLPPALRNRVLTEASGNPLGIVELGAAAARAGGAALLPSSLPLSARLERTFGGLVADLPPATRRLLLIAALDDRNSLDEIRAAGSILAGAEVPIDAIQPAVAARLVTVDEQYHLWFRHPLLRSALGRQAPPGDRRRVHAALAELLADSPQRRLWHRAAAAPGPDEKLARELTEVAVGAAQQQAVAVALAAVGRAVELSEDPAERGRRQIWTSDLAFEQGDMDTVRRLFDEIDVGALRPADRARLTWMRETVFRQAWTGPERLTAYAELIDRMRLDGDVDIAVKALDEIALRIYYSGAPAAVHERYAEVTIALGLAEDDSRRTEILLQVAPIEHGAAGLAQLRQFVHRLDLAPVRRCQLAIGAFSIGALDIARTLALASAHELRAQGRIGILAHALSTAASAAAALGDVRASRPLAAESIALSTETGQATWVLGGHLVAGLAEALCGEVTSARERADAAEQALQAAGQLPMLALVQRVRGLAALAEGHAEDAFRQLMRIFDPADSAYFVNFHLLTLGHLAEAAVLAGLRAELRPVVSALEPVAERSQSPALLVGIGYARAVLTGDYETALAADLTGWPFDRARVQLTYGAALRRGYRIMECRPLLRAAAGTFDALGATPWANRARAELRATGETRRKPSDALAALTPQEQQIARLAAEGLSNREIGERLFLSPRTVSTHLYRIYPKVGVRSRAELARIITSSDVV